MPAYRLHGFCQSGNTFKVAQMLALCDADWEPVFVDYFHGQTRSPAFREGVNAMGEVPVLEHEGRTLSQSGVILTYLAERLGRFGGRSEDEKLEVLRWLLFDNHKLTSYLATYRFLRSFAADPPSPDVLAYFKGRADGALGIVEKHLAGRSFVLGDRPTIADLSMSAYLHYPREEAGYDYPESHPAIAAWLERIRALPGWKEPYSLLPGERIAPRR